VPGLDQIRGHPAAHVAEADEGDFHVMHNENAHGAADNHDHEG
jgi:hypothetical protein